MQTNGRLQFKPCTITQLNILHQIAVQSYKESYTQIWHDQGAAYLERFYDESTLASNLEDPSCTFYLMYQQESAIGFFKLRENALTPYSTTDCLELNKIYILQAFTGMGFGLEALRYIVELAATRDRSILWLNVMEESKARKFYEAHGFEKVKQVALEYPFIKEGLNVLCTYKLAIQNFR
jgi:GNAT superfamily N-acetyltransferase